MIFADHDPGQPKDRELLAAPKLAILVVDDSEDSAELLGELLNRRGHVVRTAVDGSSALEVLDHYPADVVLLDVGLPDMDGYELAAAIRARFARRVRLVAVTGFRGDQARESALQAGIDVFIEKPFRIDEVEASLRRSDP